MIVKENEPSSSDKNNFDVGVKVEDAGQFLDDEREQLMSDRDASTYVENLQVGRDTSQTLRDEGIPLHSVNDSGQNVFVENFQVEDGMQLPEFQEVSLSLDAESEGHSAFVIRTQSASGSHRSDDDL